MLLPILLTLFSQFNYLNSQAVDANGITLLEKIEEAERRALDPQQLLPEFVTPCRQNAGGPPSEQEQTSAQWTRIVFHDAITKNFAGPGLGGVDASIGFESDRPENVGVFVNVTLGQFTGFVNPYQSMADLIALGLSFSLASCANNGRFLPFRVGRMDATGPGPAGVPGPADSVEFASSAFSRAGFSQSEMIQAIACGHSLGGVHATNFPDIVPNSTIDEANTHGRDSFDSTPDVFDNTVVHEYLTGTGKRGGPLVTTFNETGRSDLRIFSSDQNATITAMSSPTAFENTCFTIFEKLVNTVPDAVTLSDPIIPRTWIVRESHLDLNPDGTPRISGVIVHNSRTVTAPITAAYFYITSEGLSIGGTTGVKSSQPSVLFGTISSYNFSDVLSSPSITSFNVQNSYTTPINLNLFIIPSQSIWGSTTVDGNATSQFLLSAALLTKLAPSGTELTATMWYTASQSGSVALRSKTLTFPLTSFKTQGVYTIFQGIAPPAGFFSERYFQVKLGVAQASAKVNKSFFKVCGSNVFSC